MFLQRIARLLGHHALHWFYRVDKPLGQELLPAYSPLLVVSNHPNQLVDVLGCAEAIGSDMALTGKSTLFKNPVMRFLLPRLGALPIARRQDSSDQAPVDNKAVFKAIHRYWRGGGPVLLFPEGKSYTHPHMAPLKTGAARLALSARDQAGIKGLKIVPIGLLYEKKWQPRSRLGITIAPLIDIDNFQGSSEDPESVRQLTQLIADRLDQATLNFASGSDAKNILFTSELLAEQESPGLCVDTPPVSWALVSQKASRLRNLQAQQPDAYQSLLAQSSSLRARLKEAGLKTEHLNLNLSLRAAVRFVFRALPFLAWHLLMTSISRLIHAPAFFASGYFGKRAKDNSDPAMNIIVSASFLTVGTYVFFILLAFILGHPLWALLVLIFPAIGYVDLLGRDQYKRLLARSRTWLMLRKRPELRSGLVERAEAISQTAASLGV